MKTTSCGILILNARDELLLCHATGTANWDIPKGGADAGESELQTAIRETEEECGLTFAADDLLDLGHFSYRPRKDLHLFACLIEPIDTRQCYCTSQFRDLWGRVRPEMDAFEWTPFVRIPLRCARNMISVLTQAISLPQVLLQLQSKPRQPPRPKPRPPPPKAGR